MSDDLTLSQRFVLAWLDSDDRGGLYGECRSADLDELVALGLAQLPRPLSDWGYVTITEAGRKALDGGI